MPSARSSSCIIKKAIGSARPVPAHAVDLGRLYGRSRNSHGSRARWNLLSVVDSSAFLVGGRLKLTGIDLQVWTYLGSDWMCGRDGRCKALE
mmetsp:Transcript_24425/g.35274  ORF Transcript_24425/g.35274 Transcript_24425/m.35274 type:complete len:92 (-) Transcript_24425:186-461(-)